MRKKKNNKVILILLIVIIGILSILCTLFATGIISFNEIDNTNNHNNDSFQNDAIDNEITNNNDKNENDNNLSDNSTNDFTIDEEAVRTQNWIIDEDAKKYITLEEISLTSEVSTKKVKFINIDDSIASQFYKNQQAVIDNVHIYNDEYTKGGAEYHVKASISNNILSVLYLLEEKNAIGECGTKMAVVNIDLNNNKVITQEELLTKVNTSYQKLVEDYYDEKKTSWKNLNDKRGFDIDYYGLTLEDFSVNKDKYINIGLEKLPDLIYVYIENGKIKYYYYSIHIMSLFHPVGKGGCFWWETLTLGDYK